MQSWLPNPTPNPLSDDDATLGPLQELSARDSRPPTLALPLRERFGMGWHDIFGEERAPRLPHLQRPPLSVDELMMYSANHGLASSLSRGVEVPTEPTSSTPISPRRRGVLTLLAARLLGPLLPWIEGEARGKKRPSPPQLKHRTTPRGRWARRRPHCLVCITPSPLHPSLSDTWDLLAAICRKLYYCVWWWLDEAAPCYK